MEVYSISSIDEIDTNQWDNVVHQSEVGSVFQSSSWIRAIETVDSFTPAHTIVEKNGNPICIFPNIVSDLRLPGSISRQLPTTVTDRLNELSSLDIGYGGPVPRADEEKSLTLAIDQISEIEEVISHYLYTRSNQYLKYNSLFEELGYSASIVACRFDIPLEQGHENIREHMHKNRRYDMRRVDNSEVTVEEEVVTDEAISKFYDIYLDVMDRVGGDPNPRSLFTGLRKHAADNIIMFAARLDGEVIGRHLYVIDEPQATIHHWFSAVNKADFDHNPSEAIHDHAMRWAREAGFETYDFGPAPYDFRDGLFRYKREYGGDLHPIIAWERGTSPLWPVYRFGRSFYRQHINI